MDPSPSSSTVTWHVDDLKVSHIELRVNDAFIEHFKHLYNRDSLKSVTVTRGKIHDYLGINLDYTHDGSVRISMIKYVDKTFKQLSHFSQLVSVLLMMMTGTSSSVCIKIPLWQPDVTAT